MKKLSIMILFLISISVAFVGCGKNEEKLCKDVVKDFAVEMYNQSGDELKKLDAPPTEKDGQENYESNIKSSFDVFKKFFTDEGFENLINNKTLSTYYNYLIEKKMNMVFFDISYNDITNSIDQITVKCTVSFNLMNPETVSYFSKEGTTYKELEDDIYITLTPIDGEWKIDHFNITPLKILDDR